MTDTQHTPGPWQACRSHETFNGPMWDIDDDERAEWEAKPFVAIEAERRTVMRAHDLFEMRSADARLIAACPKMLAALVNAESAMFHVCADGGFATSADRQAMEDALAAVRAAIAEATGQAD